MNGALPRARLYPVGGATPIVPGGLPATTGHWNRAEAEASAARPGGAS